VCVCMCASYVCACVRACVRACMRTFVNPKERECESSGCDRCCWLSRHVPRGKRCHILERAKNSATKWPSIYKRRWWICKGRTHVMHGAWWDTLFTTMVGHTVHNHGWTHCSQPRRRCLQRVVNDARTSCQTPFGRKRRCRRCSQAQRTGRAA
jgi:hypothetical protein